MSKLLDQVKHRCHAGFLPSRFFLGGVFAMAFLAALLSAPIAPAAEPSTPANEDEASTPSSGDPQALAAGANAFAFDLWEQTRKTAQGNFAISPASISTAFAMAYGGAKGETAAQIKQVFHFPSESGVLMNSWGQLARSLEDPQRSVTLRIANRLFGEKTYSFEQSYLDDTGAAFGAALEPVDFKTAFEPSREHINTWVAERTEQRIKNLLPKDSVNPLTRMVLVNAIYFLGEWREPFNQKWTHLQPFYLSATRTRDVQMMHQTGYFAAAQVDAVKLLELPYKGEDMSFLAVLPEQTDGLAALEASLSAGQLESWQHALKQQRVSVALPRFELNPAAPLKLASSLSALGMPLPFTPEADFTAMANPVNPDERIHISEAYHKAFVKVDERGTEAAAATAIVMMATASPSLPFEFKADRPFLFFIIDKASGLVLFMGRVTHPSS